MTHTIWKHMGLCMTGSCNVITLNINRIVQNAYRKYKLNSGNLNNYIKNELISILERVYKYHIVVESLDLMEY